MANLYEKITQFAKIGVYRIFPPATQSSKIEYHHITKVNFDGSFETERFDEKGRKIEVMGSRDIPFGETPSFKFVPINMAPVPLIKFYKRRLAESKLVTD